VAFRPVTGGTGLPRPRRCSRWLFLAAPEARGSPLSLGSGLLDRPEMPPTDFVAIRARSRAGPFAGAEPKGAGRAMDLVSSARRINSQ
jgi:hypothetical protein